MARQAAEWGEHFRDLKAFAETSGDPGVYALDSIPEPAHPTPSAAPAVPTSITLILRAQGFSPWPPPMVVFMGKPGNQQAAADLASPMSADGGPGPGLSIVIPTLHRRESLLETLRALDPGSMPAEAEIIVVDNAPEPELDRAELEAAGAGRLRLLHEPKPGKWRCLNTAIGTGPGDGLGELIAVLDDDMAPMPGWAAAVLESARANPGFDLFAGKSHVVWPDGARVPQWGGHFLAQGVCFSVLTWDGGDREMGGNFPHPSGNHFWFRRGVLGSVASFPPGWTSEAEFCMEARSRGHRGALVSGVTCGHRVQPELIDVGVFLNRARRFGCTLGTHSTE